MPDPIITATDYFDLDASLIPQRSSENTTETSVAVLGPTGNIECETTGLATQTKYESVYKYCGGGSPDIATALGTALTAFGGVVESKVLNELAIRFAQGVEAEVTAGGIQFAENAITAINAANVAAAVPANAGFGVPTLTGVTLGDDATPSSLELRFSCQTVTAMNHAGNHFASQNIRFRAEATAEYVGIPTSFTTVTNWITDDYTESDDVEDFQSASWAGHRYFDVNTGA
jgi:hypothetical protein